MTQMQDWMGSDNRGLSLVRRSWYGQEDNSSGMVQEKEIKLYCEEKGIRLVKTENIIESAKDSDFRKKFNSAIQWALKNKVRHLLYYMTDREVRNFTDLEKMEKLILSDRIVVHYVRDRRQLHKYSAPSDFSTREIEAWRDKQLSRTISVKVNDAMRDKAERGWFPSNHLPLGYALKKLLDEDGKERKRGAIVVPDPDAKRVRQAQLEFEYRAKGMSYGDIRKAIIEHSEKFIPLEEQKSYGISVIEKRIKNPFYGGYFKWQGQEYKGKHELIIAPKMFIAAQGTLRGVKNTKRVFTDTGYFGGGLLKCAECGCNITYDPKVKTTRAGKKTTFHYYHCTNRKNVHFTQRGMNLSEEKIFKQLDKAVDAITLTPKLAREIAEALNESHKKIVSSGARKIADLKEQIKALEAREDNAFESMTSGVLDSEGFKRQVARLRDDRKRVTEQIQAMEAQMKGSYRETALSALELCKDAKSLYLSRSREERANFVKRLCSNFLVEGLTVRYEIKKPFSVLAKMASNYNWRPLRDSNSCIHRERVVS